MEKLENRNNVRIANQIHILNLLRKEKMTISNLAKNLDVSFTAVSHIVEEMVSEKLIKYSSKISANLRGRLPILVEINNSNGVVCGIDFSSRDINIYLSTLDNKIICQDSISHDYFISKEHIVLVEEKIKELLKKPEIKNRKLLSICIASPGLIRPKSFEYASVYRIKDFHKINPVTYLKDAFNVNVEMYNDVKIACLAEIKYGAFANKPANSMFIHLGRNAGISLVFDGKIYQGTNSFSGETPLYSTNDDIAIQSCWSNRLFAIWEISNKIRELKGLSKSKPNEEVDLDQIVTDYKNNDPITIQAINESCKRNAITIIGLSSILDLETVVIEGPILKFGEHYLEQLRKYVNEFSETQIRTRIIASLVGEDCSFVGACYQAATIHFLDTIQNITRKRIKSPSFTINDAFKEI